MEPIEAFHKEGGQEKLVNYPLSLSSVVFDVGGYKGDWAAKLLQRGRLVCEHCGGQQDPYVHIFEPVKEFADICTRRFKDFPRVKIHNFGLSNYTHDAQIKLDESASTILPAEQTGQTVELKDITEFCYQNQIDRIDLISINIEGGEYDLIPRIIHSGLINQIKNLQVQFHEIGGAHDLRHDIRNNLQLTHNNMWNYPFVWESWTRLT